MKEQKGVHIIELEYNTIYRACTIDTSEVLDPQLCIFDNCSFRDHAKFRYTANFTAKNCNFNNGMTVQSKWETKKTGDEITEACWQDFKNTFNKIPAAIIFKAYHDFPNSYSSHIIEDQLMRNNPLELPNQVGYSYYNNRHTYFYECDSKMMYDLEARRNKFNHYGFLLVILETDSGPHEMIIKQHGGEINEREARVIMEDIL